MGEPARPLAGGIVGEPPRSYWQRREQIASLAAGVDAAPVDIDYLDVEHRTWALVAEALGPAWERRAARGVLEARAALGLPDDRVPQLSEVDRRLRPLTGFGYCAVEGLLPARTFFRSLSNGVFPSTQYVRWEGSPLYTPEPDVIHEVMGHANCIACPEIAELHRRAGAAIARVESDAALGFLADVFWFTVEFGVVREGGEWRAYGAGLLSSFGELDWFADHAEIRSIDIVEMGRIGYDISHYQPVLFAGSSLAEIVEIVGPFFDAATDETIARLLPA
jgi:phenylalanine-4-hydroxylase